MSQSESLKKMRAIRKLARTNPFATLDRRIAEIGRIAGGEPAKAQEPAPAAPRRQSRQGIDRMERAGETRGSSGDAE